jgi:alkylhydroperoxidase family enzyme
MRTLRKIIAEVRVLTRARRNRSDLLRYLIRRPAILMAVSTYEGSLLVSSRADTRLKALAQVKTSALVGCPF